MNTIETRNTAIILFFSILLVFVIIYLALKMIGLHSNNGVKRTVFCGDADHGWFGSF